MGGRHGAYARSKWRRLRQGGGISEYSRSVGRRRRRRAEIRAAVALVMRLSLSFLFPFFPSDLAKSLKVVRYAFIVGVGGFLPSSFGGRTIYCSTACNEFLSKGASVNVNERNE